MTGRAVIREVDVSLYIREANIVLFPFPYSVSSYLEETRIPTFYQSQHFFHIHTFLFETKIHFKLQS